MVSPQDFLFFPVFSIVQSLNHTENVQKIFLGVFYTGEVPKVYKIYVSYKKMFQSWQTIKQRRANFF